MEPNVVLVYKMETQEYLTVSDMTESEAWQTYELNDLDEFDMFNHDENQPLEGKGYFINQEYLIKIVREINEYIQKNRKLLTNASSSNETDYISSAIHIVSSDSAAGSLRVGIERPKIVIGLPDSLSIGPLWKLDEELGQTYRNQWLYEHINDEQDEFEYENKFINTLREITDLPHQIPIYIWYGENIDEQIGMRFLLYLLRNKTNDIFLMNTTALYEKYVISNVNCHEITHTSQIEPDDIRRLFEKHQDKHPLSEQERIRYKNEWKSLSHTKDVLHIWMNQEIIGVNKNYYDPLIIQTIAKLHNKEGEKDFIKVGMVIGEVLSNSNSLINPYYLEYRIRHLIYNGMLELKGIPKSMRHYRVKLREKY